MANKSAWDQLSLSERAGIIKLHVDGGILNLDDIKKSYNDYKEKALFNQSLQESRVNKLDPGGDLNKKDTVDKKLVEDVVRTTRGVTGDFISLDPPKVDLEQLGYLYDAWRVMHGSTKHVAPVNENYTGVAIEGIGVKTDDGLGFVSQQDLESLLGYDPIDFIDAYVYGGIPFEELGVYKKDVSPERHLIRSKVEKEEARGNRMNTYQTHRDTLNFNTVQYLDSLLNNGLVDYYSTNTTYKESPFNIGESGVIYDGNNSTIAVAKLPNGQTVRKAIDVFDTDPTEWNYDVGPLAKTGLGFINNNTTPYIMTSPWYLPKSTDRHTRLQDVFGIILDENYNVIGNKGDVNGVKWDLNEAFQWLDEHPNLEEMPIKNSNKFYTGGQTQLPTSSIMQQALNNYVNNVLNIKKSELPDIILEGYTYNNMPEDVADAWKQADLDYKSFKEEVEKMYYPYGIKDNSEVVDITAPNTDIAKFIYGNKISKNAIEEIKRVSELRGQDPYDVLAHMLIEKSGPYPITMHNDFNVHNVVKDQIDSRLFRYYPDREKQIKQFGIYQENKKEYTAEEIRKAAQRMKERRKVALESVIKPESTIDAVALHMLLNNRDFNPGQEGYTFRKIGPDGKAYEETAKHSYLDMIDSAISSLKENMPDLFK